jgi:hypothetical protein
VTISVDGAAPKVVSLFDSHCTSHRLSTLVLANGLLFGEHSVKVALLKEAPDKASILSTRNGTIDKPERFLANGFYPGALLLDGELLK